MNYCKKCGIQLVDGAKFCQKCGCPTKGDGETYTQRQQEFAGKVYKCPNCGEVLKSFEVKCPACGCELRGAKAFSAVKEFALKLEAIESRREYEPPKGFFKSSAANEQISKTDEQKISLIKNFSVPNTTEDMLEFMILATSNINVDIYNSSKCLPKGEAALSNAWAAKIEQVYEKGRISHGDEDTFQQIQLLYDKFNLRAKESKRKGIISWAWMPITIIVSLALIVALSVISNVRAPGAAREEIARLEAIEQEATQALENGEYKRALLTAEGLEYKPSVKGDVEGLGRYDDLVRQWDITQELLIDKILEEAAAHGVNLDYDPPADESEEPDNSAEPSDGNSTGLVGGFVDGFVKGYHEAADPGIDAAESRIAAAKDQIDAAMGTNNHEGP